MGKLELFEPKQWLLEKKDGLVVFDNEEEAVDALKEIMQAEQEGSVLLIEFQEGKIEASQLSWQDIAKYFVKS